MKLTRREAIITAIAYADIFDYPLTSEELRMWLPYIRHSLAASQESVLRRQKRLIAIRKQREAWSREKWIRARRVATLLKLIPTIALVGVTGGLARSNARTHDDIDFLIITAPHTLWITRALSTVLLELLRLRRRPGDAHFSNLICLNMFMSKDGLAIPVNERDLFTAHEVLLMTPIWERDGAYTKFLQANRWAKKFLPNAWEGRKKNYELRIMNFGFFPFILQLVEPVAKFIQLRYMKKRRSTEVVTDTLIRFHPRDARGWIKRALVRRLSRYKIPLDKIFYGR